MSFSTVILVLPFFIVPHQPLLSLGFKSTQYKWSDRCFKNQEELLEFFGYEMIEDLNADAVYARRVETFTDEYEKELMKFCDAGNQIKVIGVN